MALALLLLAALIMLPNQQARAGTEAWSAGAAPRDDAGSLVDGPTDRTSVNADEHGALALPGSSSSFDGADTFECELVDAKPTSNGGKPTITITDWPTSVTEGEPINITLTRTEDAQGEFPALKVAVRRSEAGQMIGRPWWSFVDFDAGCSTALWQIPTANDTVNEKTSVVTAMVTDPVIPGDDDYEVDRRPRRS